MKNTPYFKVNILYLNGTRLGNKFPSFPIAYNYLDEIMSRDSTNLKLVYIDYWDENMIGHTYFKKLFTDLK